MAQKYNVDVNKIRKANNVGTGGIFIGTGSGNRESLFAVRGTGSSAICIYDKVLYELVMTNLTNIEPNGGTYSASSYSTTNKKTHGNGAVETGLALNASSVTIPANTSTAETKSGSVTVTQYDSDLAAYNGASVSWTWTQIKDYPTAIELTISPRVTIPASGGSVSTALTNFNYSVKCTFKSGNVVNNFNGATISANTAQVSAQSKGTTISQATSAGNITFTATYTCNGKTVTNSKRVTIMQDANAIVSYANPTFTLSPGSTYVIPASGGSITGGVSNVKQTRTYSSKSADTITLTANASTNGYTVAWTGQTQSAQSKSATTSNATSVGTITAKVTSTNGGNTTQTCVVTQQANSVTSTAWDAPTFTLSPGDTVLPASGGSVTGSVSGAKQKYTYTYTSKATSTGETTTGLSTNWTGQTQSAGTRGTIVGDAKSIGTTTAKVTGSGSKSTTKSYTVTQQANAITDYGSPYGITASCADIPASGGTVTASVNTTTASQRVDYTSKASATTTGTASISWSPRNTSSASSLETTVKAKTAIETLTMMYALNGKSSSFAVIVYQEANSITSYGNPYGITASCADIPASGGTVTASVNTTTASQQVNYKSKASATTTGTATVSWSPRQTASASTLGTTVKSRTSAATLTATYTLNGKSNTTSVTVYQQANSASYENPYGITASCADIPASGGTVTAAANTTTASQKATYTSKASGTTTGTASLSWSPRQTATGSNLGTTTKNRTSAATLTLTYTLNGKSSSTSVVVYQQANGYNDVWGNPSVTISPSSSSVGSAATSTSFTGTASQSGTRTWTSTCASTVSYSDFKWAWSSNQGWATANSTTNVCVVSFVGNPNTSSRSASITAAVSGATNKTASKTVILTQAAAMNKPSPYFNSVTLSTASLPPTPSPTAETFTVRIAQGYFVVDQSAASGTYEIVDQTNNDSNLTISYNGGTNFACGVLGSPCTPGSSALLGISGEHYFYPQIGTGATQYITCTFDMNSFIATNNNVPNVGSLFNLALIVDNNTKQTVAFSYNGSRYVSRTLDLKYSDLHGASDIKIQVNATQQY